VKLCGMHSEGAWCASEGRYEPTYVDASDLVRVAAGRSICCTCEEAPTASASCSSIRGCSEYCGGYRVGGGGAPSWCALLLCAGLFCEFDMGAAIQAVGCRMRRRDHRWNLDVGLYDC
jgi:hypothetical protein